VGSFWYRSIGQTLNKHNYQSQRRIEVRFISLDIDELDPMVDEMVLSKVISTKFGK